LLAFGCVSVAFEKVLVLVDDVDEVIVVLVEEIVLVLVGDIDGVIVLVGNVVLVLVGDIDGVIALVGNIVLVLVGGIDGVIVVGLVRFDLVQTSSHCWIGCECCSVVCPLLRATLVF